MNTEIPSVSDLARMTLHRPHQTETLSKEIRTLEWALHGRSAHNGAPMPQFDDGLEPHSREVLAESIERTGGMLARHDAEQASFQGALFNQVQKNKLYQFMMQTLEPRIRDGNPTHEMMQNDSSENVDWWRSWHQARKVDILAWRTIRRILDPRNDNPNFCNVTLLRKHKLSGTDPRKYWQNFEAIAFTERVEADIDAISDEQYLLFLNLKALEYAPALICKQLGWTKQTYEAAMHRLREAQGLVPEDLREEEVDADGDEFASSTPMHPEQHSLPQRPTRKDRVEAMKLNKSSLAHALHMPRLRFFGKLSDQKLHFTREEAVALDVLLDQAAEDQTLYREHYTYTAVPKGGPSHAR